MKKLSSLRKPQITLALEAEEKALIERVAAKRGVSVSALLKLLSFDEARRLGIE
jgi:uncharacterized protein (DUF1778 family)